MKVLYYLFLPFILVAIKCPLASCGPHDYWQRQNPMQQPYFQPQPTSEAQQPFQEECEKRPITDEEFLTLVHTGARKPVNEALMRLSISPSTTPCTEWVKTALALYFGGSLRTLELRESPILTNLRSHAPDTYLLKFVEENPQVLKYLVHSLFFVFEKYSRLDTTMYKITEKLIAKAKYQLRLTPNNRELYDSVQKFEYFDQVIKAHKQNKKILRETSTSLPTQEQLQWLVLQRKTARITGPLNLNRSISQPQSNGYPRNGMMNNEQTYPTNAYPLRNPETYGSVPPQGPATYGSVPFQGPAMQSGVNYNNGGSQHQSFNPQHMNMYRA